MSKGSFAYRVLSTVIGAAALPAAAVGGQTPLRRVAVSGVVYDSLHSQPLKNAFISIRGKSLNTTTDLNGRFHFDSVPPGDYVFTAQHESLDSLGFSGFSSHATAVDGTHDVTISIPSFETLWRTACGGARPAPEAGFVYGTVRDAVSRRAVPDAYVYLTWSEAKIDKTTQGVQQRLWRGDTRSDSTGHYSICGVTTGFWLRVSAGVGARASGWIDLPPQDNRLERRDLFIGSTIDTSHAMRGTIVGLVTAGEGQPVADADVTLDDSAHVRTTDDGRFVLRNVLIGTRQVEVRLIGMSPAVSVVDVRPGDTSAVAVPMRKVTTLDIVRVMASEKARMFSRELDERRKAGFGIYIDAADIQWRHEFATVFTELPNLHVEATGNLFKVSTSDARGGKCYPDVWIDAMQSSQEGLTLIDPKTTVAVEVYNHSELVPTKFAQGGIKPLCGVILVWTTFAFK
jgi:hypothetical protein